MLINISYFKYLKGSILDIVEHCFSDIFYFSSVYIEETKHFESI